MTILHVFDKMDEMGKTWRDLNLESESYLINKGKIMNDND